MADLSIKLKTEADAESFIKSVNALSKKVAPVNIKISSAVSDGLGTLEKRLGPLSSQIANTYERLASLRMEGSLSEDAFVKLSSKVDKVRESLAQGNTTFAKGAKALDEVTKAAEGSKQGFFQLSQGIMDAISKFTMWYLISGLVTGTINAIKQMVAEVISLDASMVELNKVFDASSEELERVKDRAFELADDLGTTGKAVIDATTEFKRMGYTIDESLDLARVAIMMTNVAEGITDAGEAANILTAILKGTGVSTEYAMSLLDRLNEVSNNNAISFDALAHMLQESAASMSVLGNNIDETIGMLTGAYAVIQDEKVGKALTTIGLRIAGLNEDLQEEAGLANDVSKALQKYAGINVFDEQTGQIRSTYEIMKDLAGVWDDLNKNEQTMLLNVLAGKQRADVAAAMLTNWKEVDKAIQDASKSMGSAAKEQEAYLNSIEGKIQSFKNVFQELADTIIDSDIIKGFIDIGTGILKVIRWVTQLIEKLGGLKTIILTLTSVMLIFKAQAIAGLIASVFSFIKTIPALIAKLIAWTAATWAQFTAQMSLQNALTMGVAAVGIIAGITAVTVAVSSLTNSTNDATESAEDMNDEYKDLSETFENSEKEISDYDKALNKLKKTLKELNAENKETLSNLKEQNEKIKEQKDLNDKLLAVEKARQELAEAKNKRVRIFRAGIGFTYETDVSAVQTAQESLQSAVDELSEFKYNLALSRAEEFVENFTEILSGKEITEGWQELFDNFADLMGTEFEYFLTNAKKSIENFNSMLGEKDSKISLSSTSDISSGLTNGNISMPSTAVGQSSNFSVGSISNPTPQIASAGKNITLQFNGPLEFPNVKNAEDASGFIDAVVSVGNSRVPKYN